MRPSLLTAAAALLGGLLAGPAAAGPILYTFEAQNVTDAPSFTLGQTTPLPNEPPNVGPSTFRTDFTDPATPTGFMIANVGGGLAPLSGQVLTEFSTADPLTLTFNTPVSALSVDFLLVAPVGNPAGFLELITPSGTATQTGMMTNPLDQGGTLTFSAAVPFTTATLLAFAPGGIGAPGGPQQPTLFAIDNLSLTPAAPAAVPEPSALALLGLGAAALAVWRRRRA